MTTYADKVTSGLIQHFPLEESPGATTANDSSAENNDGTISGATLAAASSFLPRKRAPSFDGTDDIVTGNSAGLQADFNGSEGTVVIWAKVASAGVWTDVTVRDLVNIAVDASNLVRLRKLDTDNTFQWSYIAGGTTETRTKTTSPTDWFCVAITWSKSNDRVRAYYNGVQEGADLTALGVWAGIITRANIGAQAAATLPFSGYLSHYRLYNRELTAAEIASLAVIDSNYGLEIVVDWNNDGAYTGLYDNITADVIENQDINFSLGYAPYKFVAEESLLTFAVDNTSGKYSPENSASALYGSLKPNRPMQVRYNGIAQWTGRLRGLKLEGQRYSLDRIAILECVSQKEILDKYTIYPDLSENVTADAVIADIAALLGLATDLDTGQVPIRYIGDMLQTREEMDSARRGMSAYELLEELMKAERGHIFFDGAGTLYFRSRYALISDTVVDYIFDNTGKPAYITSVDEMVNRFEVTYFPRTASAEATEILWQNEGIIHIPAGTIRTISAMYQDEFRKAVGAKDVQTPSGSDLVYSTGTTTLSITKRAQRAEIELDNTAGLVDAVITTLIVRGRIIKSSYPAETAAEDTASVTDVGLRIQSETLRPVDNENDAHGIAAYELAKRSGIAGRVEALDLRPEKADGSIAPGVYAAKVPTSQIQYLQLDESSGTTANDSSSENNDGAYTAVTLAAETSPIMPDPAPSFNGTTSHVNLYSAALDTDFNELLGSIVLWVKVSASGVWSDGAIRAAVALGADTNNYITIYKPVANNQLIFEYKAGGTTVSRTATSQSSADWICLAVTWNKANNRVRAYIDGAQVGADVSGLGVWVGALGATKCTLGAFNTGANFWSGYLSHYRLYNAELTAAQIALLAEDRVSGFSYQIHDLVRVIDGQAYHDENYHITRIQREYDVANKILRTTLELEPAYVEDFWILDVSSLGLDTRLAY